MMQLNIGILSVQLMIQLNVNICIVQQPVLLLNVDILRVHEIFIVQLLLQQNIYILRVQLI